MENKEMTHRAQKLRTNATPEENILWYQYLRKHPVQFRRQHPFGQYIVDFYCAKAKLVIELDGSQHYFPEAQQKDALRTRYLESLGLQVLRFSNSDIRSNLRGVCQQVDLTIKERIKGDIPLIRPCGPPSPKGKVTWYFHKIQEDLCLILNFPFPACSVWKDWPATNCAA